MHFREFNFVMLGSSVAPALIIGALSIPTRNWCGIILGGGVLTTVLAAVVLDRTAPHGRGRTLKSQLRRRLAWLLVAPVQGCGCFATAGAETINSELYLQRRRSEGVVEYTVRKRRIRRCHNCGRHYHDDVETRLDNLPDGSPIHRQAFESDPGYKTGGTALVWPEDDISVHDETEVEIEDVS